MKPGGETSAVYRPTSTVTPGSSVSPMPYTPASSVRPVPARPHRARARTVPAQGNPRGDRTHPAITRRPAVSAGTIRGRGGAVPPWLQGMY